MTRFADWCAFLGAWLLFAGPVYQAETELDAEAREASELRPVLESAVTTEDRPSMWWWLVPPAGYLRHRRWGRDTRRRVLDALTPAQTAQMVRFREKALGWELVAGGACLIALDETWVVVHAYRWPTLVFWLLVGAMVLGSVGFVATRARRRYSMLELERPGTAARRRREQG